MKQTKIFGGYRTMWIMVMFDLPTDTPKAKIRYTNFRKNLLQNGFDMMQFSVYARHTASEENAQVHIQRIKRAIPEEGHIRILKFTDKQFSKMLVFFGKMRKKPEKPTQQLVLF